MFPLPENKEDGRSSTSICEISNFKPQQSQLSCRVTHPPSFHDRGLRRWISSQDALSIYFHAHPEKKKKHPAAYISKLQPDTLHCFLRTNTGRPDLPRMVTQQRDWWRDIIRRGERGGEDAKGFRQLVYRAVNKHIVCQQWGGVALFRCNNQTLGGGGAGRQVSMPWKNTRTESKHGNHISLAEDVFPLSSACDVCSCVAVHALTNTRAGVGWGDNLGVKHELAGQQLTIFTMCTCSSSLIVFLHYPVLPTVTNMLKNSTSPASYQFFWLVFFIPNSSGAFSHD